LNIDCVLDLSDDVSIDSQVNVAHRVMLITSFHEIGDEWQRASGFVDASDLHRPSRMAGGRLHDPAER
jgi:hypothetical protein